jgi:peroxiredoxin
MTTTTRANRPNRHGGANSGKSSRPRPSRRGSRKHVAAAVVAALAVLAGLFMVYNTASSSDSPQGGTDPRSYDVGSPGVGETAPGFSLPASTGETIDLADYRGQTVLLYFQEGLMCQPCWDQITDLEQSGNKVEGVGVDAMVSITTDPVDLITRKVRDEGITTPVLSDPDLAVSREYSTNQYGMMGDSRNGHSFILVGPDGQIQWRADYGGAPDYTMYVPVERLLTDLREGKETPTT